MTCEFAAEAEPTRPETPDSASKDVGSGEMRSVEDANLGAKSIARSREAKATGRKLQVSTPQRKQKKDVPTPEKLDQALGSSSLRAEAPAFYPNAEAPAFLLKTEAPDFLPKV